MRSIRNKVVQESTARATAGAVSYDQSEIAALVEKASGRDFEAFGELYGIYLDRIYRYVFGYLRDRMTAQDVTEEVFLKAWKAISSCKGKEETFLPWLYRIAHNHVIDHHRRRQKRLAREIRIESPADIIAGTDDVERGMELRMEQQQALEAISRLPERQKQVIILKFVEGMDNREIGQVMGKSEGNIRVLQMRALTTLRRRLGRGK